MPLAVSFSLLIEDQGPIKANFSAVFDPFDSDQFLLCPWPTSFFQKLCPFPSCYTMNYSHPGSSVHGFSREEYQSG